MQDQIYSLLQVVRTSLGYLMDTPPEWLVWTVLTVLLAMPVFGVLKLLGFGSGPKKRLRPQSGENALDRMLASTEEIPEARQVVRIRK